MSGRVAGRLYGGSKSHRQGKMCDIFWEKMFLPFDMPFIIFLLVVPDSLHMEQHFNSDSLLGTQFHTEMHICIIFICNLQYFDAEYWDNQIQ